MSGFCYELNGLFAVLLREPGFDVNLLSGRVMDSGEFGPEFDHLTLLVQLDDDCRLADVGFGDSFREPLRLEESIKQVQYGIAYRFDNSHGLRTLLRRLSGHNWEPQYRFTPQPRRLADFATMCRYH